MDILLVEDSAGDIRLMREAFRECDKRSRLHLAGDGIEALAFLRQEGRYCNAPRPNLVLLDLGLPRLDGRNVLTEIKNDPALKTIPVIILTTSEAESDVLVSYREQANCYLRKPAHWDAFDELLRTTNSYWFTRAQLPEQVRTNDT